MKIAENYNQAHRMITERCGPWPRADHTQHVKMLEIMPQIGVDIGKQFGTRIIMHITPEMAHKLLVELERRDLPFPQVISTPQKIWIGAEPE